MVGYRQSGVPDLRHSTERDSGEPKLRFIYDLIISAFNGVFRRYVADMNTLEGCRAAPAAAPAGNDGCKRAKPTAKHGCGNWQQNYLSGWTSRVCALRSTEMLMSRSPSAATA